MRGLVVVVVLFGAACSNILGIGDPKHRGDAGVGSANVVNTATLPGLTAIGPDDTPPTSFRIVDPRVDGVDTVCSGAGATKLCLAGGLTP